MERFGGLVGQIIFEILSVSERFRALIISFGERTFTLISKIRISIIRGGSNLKKTIKRHSGVRKALRISGYVLSLDIAKNLMATLGLPELPFPSDIGLGLIVIANG